MVAAISWGIGMIAVYSWVMGLLFCMDKETVSAFPFLKRSPACMT